MNAHSPIAVASVVRHHTVTRQPEHRPDQTIATWSEGELRRELHRTMVAAQMRLKRSSMGQHENALTVELHELARCWGLRWAPVEKLRLVVQHSRHLMRAIAYADQVEF